MARLLRDKRVGAVAAPGKDARKDDMSTESLHDYLKRRVQHLNTRIRDAERKADSSDPRTHVKLAAELKILRERKEQLEERLARIEDQSEAAMGGLKAELVEDADLLEAALQRWFDKY